MLGDSKDIQPAITCSGLSFGTRSRLERLWKTKPVKQNLQDVTVMHVRDREAAKECRRKKKEYVKCLENRVAVLENQNKTLIEELKSLKELYCQKDGHS